MEFKYKGLEATMEKLIISDEEVDRQMEKLRQQMTVTRAITDRPAQLGDEVILDYAGFCDGEQFPGGTANAQPLKLGSGMFIPGFEEQLVGKCVDEKVDVVVRFPDDYHAAHLAGKEAVFHCMIQEIQVHEPYAMDDTFAREVGKCDNLEAMHAMVKNNLQSHSDNMAETDLREDLIRQAAESLDFEADEAAVEQAIDDSMSSLRIGLAEQKLTIDDYCKFTNQTEEQLREDLRPEAIANLRVRAALAKVAELENLEATQDEIDAYGVSVMQQSGMSMEEIRAAYQGDFDATVKQNVLTLKAILVIRDSAVIKVVEKTV